MITENLLVWNVRGLNARARRNAVRQLVADQCVSLQETKLADCDDAIVRELVGTNFDFFSLPAAQTSGGILLAWNKDIWSATSPIYRDFSISLHISHMWHPENLGGSRWSMGHRVTNSKSSSLRNYVLYAKLAPVCG